MTATLLRNSNRLGAIFYVLWGLLHLYAAYVSYKLGVDEATGFAQGKLFQNAWNLAYISLFGIFVAVVWNWRNSALGYWLNAVTISATDIGFIVLIMAPGYSTDVLGPVLWLLGLGFTTVGYVSNARTA
jgi:hypothetical protein